MKKQSDLSVMLRLLKILKPLNSVMMITIFFGVLGFLASISITTFASIYISSHLGFEFMNITTNMCLIVIIVGGLLRGPFRYIEQYSGHFIAFTILKIIRDKVYLVLRKLAPAKLETKKSGELISIITSDIELLEVFYAHTIAPISIAVIMSTIVSVGLYFIHPMFCVIAVVAFITIGYLIPVLTSKLDKEDGKNYRDEFAVTNNFLLESLRGINEILFFSQGNKRLEEINNSSDKLNKKLAVIKKHEALIKGLTDSVIMISIVVIFLVGVNLLTNNEINQGELIIALVTLASSFGPVVALSNLSTTLKHTFSCARRVFAILDEEPEVKEIKGQTDINSFDIKIDNIDFKYQSSKDYLFKDLNLAIKEKEKIAILGASGKGKSTLIKLIMRFWDVEKGQITLDNQNIKTMPTKTIRKNQTLITQDPFLFNDTVANNIKIGNINATEKQVIDAAKKASIHDFIMDLKDGYNTNVGTLGENLSSGEKQRICVARAFLHNSNILILDEPTSNLDTLNEAQILKSIDEEANKKTVIMVSHRKSSTAICDKKIYL